MSIFFILGAKDPEMDAIEAILQSAAIDYGYAAIVNESRRIVRVAEKDAHAATMVITDYHSEYGHYIAGMPKAAPGDIIAVECSGPISPTGAKIIDPHWPGSNIFGRPPEDYMGASSIGQVLSIIAHIMGNVMEWPTVNVTVADEQDIQAGDWCVDHLVTAVSARHAELAKVPETIRFAAAADHCRTAALEGKCPNVDSLKLKLWLDNLPTNKEM